MSLSHSICSPTRKLVIIGASGHGKVIADIELMCGYADILFLDDNPAVSQCAGFPVVGTSSMAGKLGGRCDYVVAIGNPMARERIQESIDGKLVTLVHPNATIGRCVEIGEGTVVMAGAVVNSDTVIGKGVIVNTCASVDHDCRIANYVHVSVGAHVAGTVDIHERTWLGIGSCVTNNVSICSDCMVGAGAVVVRDIDVSGTYVGIPARFSHVNENWPSAGLTSRQKPTLLE